MKATLILEPQDIRISFYQVEMKQRKVLTSQDMRHVRIGHAPALTRRVFGADGFCGINPL